MQVKKQQLELDMEEQTGSKLGKEYIKAVYCHPAYLTYTQSTSYKMLGWMKTVKEESEKVGLKLNIQKTKIMAFGPMTSWQIVSLNFIVVVTIFSDFGAQEKKMSLFPLFPHLFAME